jgi:hypothetical protein
MLAAFCWLDAIITTNFSEWMISSLNSMGAIIVGSMDVPLAAELGKN